MAKLSPDQVGELKKCRDSVVYFVATYCYLKHTTLGKIPWDHPYTYQVRLLEALQDGEDIFVCKSRRVGASWTCCAYALWRILFFPDLSVLLLSRKEFYAKGLLKRVKFMLKNLPAFLCPKTNVDSKSELSFVFRHGGEYAESNIISLTTTDESGRGEDAALIVMDEAAFIPDADETWAAVAPTTAFGGQKVVVSTPGGIGNFFHRNIMHLQAGHDIGFTYIEAHWKRDCGLSDEWYRRATAGLSVTKIQQEFELVFLSSGAPFFDLNKLAACYRPPSEYPSVVEAMVRTEMSFSGVDTGEGHPRKSTQEPDFHSIVTLNEYGVQINAWHSNTMSLPEFAGHIEELDDDADGRPTQVRVEGIPSKIHREYPGAMVIELFGPGDVTANMHQEPDDGISYTVTRRTTSTSKMRGLNSLRLAINEEAITITDHFTYACLQAFEDQTTGITERAGAARGAFDDPVMGLMMAWVALKKYGGYEFNFADVERRGGRRVVALKNADDLSHKDLVPLGDRGPSWDMGKEGLTIGPGGERLIDSLERGRYGRVPSLRPPGM